MNLNQGFVRLLCSGKIILVLCQNIKTSLACKVTLCLTGTFVWGESNIPSLMEQSDFVLIMWVKQHHHHHHHRPLAVHWLELATFSTCLWVSGCDHRAGPTPLIWRAAEVLQPLLCSVFLTWRVCSWFDRAELQEVTTTDPNPLTSLEGLYSSSCKHLTGFILPQKLTGRGCRSIKRLIPELIKEADYTNQWICGLLHN